MIKMIIENPDGIAEYMHNMAFVKDEEVYLKGIGEDGKDISLVNFCKEQYKNLHGTEIEESDPCEFGEYMDDDSLLSLFYWACVGFAEIRERLKFYEDEAERIRMSCTKPCHMGKDIKLIEREYNEGHEPYGQILAQYETQIKECPKICSSYREIL